MNTAKWETVRPETLTGSTTPVSSAKSLDSLSVKTQSLLDALEIEQSILRNTYQRIDLLHGQ